MKKYFLIVLSVLLSCQNVLNDSSKNTTTTGNQEKIKLSFLDKNSFSKMLRTNKDSQLVSREKSLEIMNKYKNIGSESIIINENIKPFLGKNTFNIKDQDTSSCVYHQYCYDECLVPDPNYGGAGSGCLVSVSHGCLVCPPPADPDPIPDPTPIPIQISLSIDKSIVSTKNTSDLTFNVFVEHDQSWVIQSNTGYSNFGIGSKTFSINSDILGSNLQDGVYTFTLYSNSQTSVANLSIDNTPPKIKSIQALDNGQVNITAEDPSVNGVSSGVAPSNQVVSVNYGNNKQASLNFSIASLNAKQTNNVLNNGNYSVDIKDNVGNTFKLSKGCVDSTNKWLTDVTKQINEYEKALKQKENKMNQLNNNLNKVITEYNSLVQEDKTLGENLISYENLLSKYEIKLGELVLSGNYELSEWDPLLSGAETLQSQIIIADERSRQLKNQIQNLSNKAKSIKGEMDTLVAETQVIKTNLNNISLDGVCISSIAGDILSKAGGPAVAVADKIISWGFLAGKLYYESVIFNNQVYSEQQSAKSKELRERSKLLIERTEHGQDRKDERKVDEEKTIREGDEYAQPDGSKVFVNGDKVVILNKEGKVITSIKNYTKSQFEKKVREGKWIPIDKDSGQSKQDRLNSLFDLIKKKK